MGRLIRRVIDRCVRLKRSSFFAFSPFSVVKLLFPV